MKALMHRAMNKQYAGVTSLLLVLAIGLILTVMVAGISALSIREQQQARKTDLSSRALQTAEAGIKLASAKLSSDPTYSKPGCNTGDNTPFASATLLATNAEITCATVTSVFTGTIEGYIEQDRSTDILMGPDYPSGVAPSYIQLDWHNVSDGAGGNYVGNLYPEVTGYSDAAGIEMIIVWWPSVAPGVFLTDGKIKTATIFFMPGKKDVGFSAMQPILPRAPVDSGCTGNPYKCSTIKPGGRPGFNLRGALGLTLAAGTPNATYNAYNMAIRIKPRYRSTHFKFGAYNSSNTEIAMQSTKAQIDVTARVDTMYRRVKAEKVILPTTVENIFDTVAFTGEGPTDSETHAICKIMVIRQDYVLAPGSLTCP